MKSKFAKIISVVAICFQAHIALAHAHIKESNPKKDSVISSMPKGVTIKFSEELELAMSKLEVKNLKTGETIGGDVSQPGGDKYSLETSLKESKKEKANFLVSWKAVSKDSHSMKGSYEFTFDPTEKK